MSRGYDFSFVFEYHTDDKLLEIIGNLFRNKMLDSELFSKSNFKISKYQTTQYDSIYFELTHPLQGIDEELYAGSIYIYPTEGNVGVSGDISSHVRVFSDLSDPLKDRIIQTVYSIYLEEIELMRAWGEETKKAETIVREALREMAYNNKRISGLRII